MSDERPAWMAGGVKRPKPPRRPITLSAAPVTQSPEPIQQSPATDRPSECIVVEAPAGSGTHRNVVVGVTLITIVTLFSVYFWLAIGIAAAVNPPEAEVSLSGGIELVTVGDYLTFGRVALGVIAGVIGTAAAWAAVDNMVN